MIRYSIWSAPVSFPRPLTAWFKCQLSKGLNASLVSVAHLSFVIRCPLVSPVHTFFLLKGALETRHPFNPFYRFHCQARLSSIVRVHNTHFTVLLVSYREWIVPKPL